MTIPEIYSLFVKSKGVNTDTRSIQAGEIFVALKGGDFNGNLYAEKAIKLGASFVLIDEVEYQKNNQRYILVNSCLHTLQVLANYHRQQFDIPVLAITGTNGKTTTKELIMSVLSVDHSVVATIGNLNNHIGVPLTLLSITRETEFAIIEMGANKVGDIRELCSIANPTHGLIINVGKAHLEGFKSFEGVIQTKTELYDFLYNGNKVAFVNGNQKELKSNASRFNSVIYFQNDESNSLTLSDKESAIKVLTPSKTLIQTNLIGGYNLDNIAAAYQVGSYFGVNEVKIREAIAFYVPTNNRSQVILKRCGTILLDAYNANPFSMDVALDSLVLSKGDKYAIIGDMFELGEYSDEEHLKVIRKCIESNVQTLFCGELFYNHRGEFKSLHFFKNRIDLVAYLNDDHNWLQAKYSLLIKGSRGMALEKVLDEVNFDV
jgi:UDP-N-acetylmuramoyl-tripeptide--D-alanyl-D-alanine ligase